MKHICLLFLLLTFGLTLNAQDYAPIFVDRVAYFIDGHYNGAYQIDSSYQIGDTLVSVLYEQDAFCQQDGYERPFEQISYIPAEKLFLTENGIHIYHNTQPGDAWSFQRSPQGDSIAARHISTDWMPVFGTADSVKKIVLSHYDAQRQLAPNGYWHDVQLLLSKEHGVLRSIDQYNRPLQYLSNPQVGQAPLTDFDIWDMEIGAELHIFEGGESSMPLAQDYTRWVILDKQISPAMDTIELSIDRMFVHFETQLATEIDTFIHDSIVLSIPIYQATYLPRRVYQAGVDMQLSRFPGASTVDYQYSIGYGTQSFYPIANRRSLDIFPFYREFINPGDTCWQGEWYPKIYEAIEGWGGWYYHTAGIDWNIDRKPIYYKDSAGSWGNPYDFGSLVTAIDIQASDEFRPILFPNPSSGNVRLELSQAYNVVEVRFYDLSGQFLERLDLSRPMGSARPFDLDLHHLAAGLYLYQLTVEGQRVQGKLVKW